MTSEPLIEHLADQLAINQSVAGYDSEPATMHSDFRTQRAPKPSGGRGRLTSTPSPPMAADAPALHHAARYALRMVIASASTPSSCSMLFAAPL